MALGFLLYFITLVTINLPNALCVKLCSKDYNNNNRRICLGLYDWDGSNCGARDSLGERNLIFHQGDNLLDVYKLNDCKGDACKYHTGKGTYNPMKHYWSGKLEWDGSYGTGTCAMGQRERNAMSDTYNGDYFYWVGDKLCSRDYNNDQCCLEWGAQSSRGDYSAKFDCWGGGDAMYWFNDKASVPSVLAGPYKHIWILVIVSLLVTNALCVYYYYCCKPLKPMKVDYLERDQTSI